MTVSRTQPIRNAIQPFFNGQEESLVTLRKILEKGNHISFMFPDLKLFIFVFNSTLHEVQEEFVRISAERARVRKVMTPPKSWDTAI